MKHGFKLTQDTINSQDCHDARYHAAIKLVSVTPRRGEKSVKGERRLCIESLELPTVQNESAWTKHGTRSLTPRRSRMKSSLMKRMSMWRPRQLSLRTAAACASSEERPKQFEEAS